MLTLYIMVGISGSGKSTQARKLLAQIQIGLGEQGILIETDAIRQKLCGDASDQSRNHQVFQFAYKQIEESLAAGFSVVFDATNLSRNDRSQPIQIGRKYGAEVVAVVINTPLAVSIERNKSRDRKVPLNVILKQQAKFMPPTFPGEVDKIIDIYE